MARSKQANRAATIISGAKRYPRQNDGADARRHAGRSWRRGGRPPGSYGDFPHFRRSPTQRKLWSFFACPSGIRAVRGHWGSANGLSTAARMSLVCRRCVGVFCASKHHFASETGADHRHISRVRSCWLVRRCQHFSRRPLKSSRHGEGVGQAGYPVVDGDKLTTGHLTSAGLRTPPGLSSTVLESQQVDVNNPR